MLFTAMVSVSMTTHKSKSGSNNFTNCNFDHTILRRAWEALSICGVVFKCSHVRTSHINDKSFVPGYVAMSGHKYMILLILVSLYVCKCAPHIKACKTHRP